MDAHIFIDLDLLFDPQLHVENILILYLGKV